MNAEVLREKNSDNVGYASPIALQWSRAEISHFAEGIAERLDYRPGEPLEPVIKRLGGKVEFVELGENDSNYGSIIAGPEGFTISLPLDSGPLRDRFTMAHEIGHYLLHYIVQNAQSDTPIKRLRANRYGSDKAEWEANWFAAAFLMPGKAFSEAFERMSKDLLAVADVFKVSHSAAVVRAKSLNLIPRD
jgi:predicted transcriptional regulator